MCQELTAFSRPLWKQCWCVDAMALFSLIPCRWSSLLVILLKTSAWSGLSSCYLDVMDCTGMLLLLPRFHLVLLVAVAWGLKAGGIKGGLRMSHRWLSVFFLWKWIFFYNACSRPSCQALLISADLLSANTQSQVGMWTISSCSRWAGCVAPSWDPDTEGWSW